MSLYVKLWDFLWTPIRLLAGVFTAYELLPRFAPWIFSAYVGRWPEKIQD